MALENDVKKAEVKTPPAPPKRSRAANLALVRQVWPWAFLTVLVISFSIASKQLNDVDFISVRSVQGILLYATQILLIALGETLIIIAAGIDLSVGWILGFSSVIAALVMQTLHAGGYSPVVTIGGGFLAGVLIAVLPGLLNGLLITRVKVPPFISTLGMGYLIEGLALLASGGYPVAKQPPYLGQIGNNFILYIWPGHGVSWFKMPEEAMPPDFPSIISIMPGVVFITILVTAVVWFILARTQFGQHLYAIGGNYEASMRAGIPVKATLVKAYVMAAVLAGVAGVLWAARFTSGAYNGGETTTLKAVAAVVIGGASMFGGEGSIIGTIVGALCIATIEYGLVILGVVPFWQFVAVGLVVILAVIVDQFGRTLGK